MLSHCIHLGSLQTCILRLLLTFVLSSISLSGVFHFFSSSFYFLLWSHASLCHFSSKLLPKGQWEECMKKAGMEAASPPFSAPNPNPVNPPPPKPPPIKILRTRSRWFHPIESIPQLHHLLCQLAASALVLDLIQFIFLIRSAFPPSQPSSAPALQSPSRCNCLALLSRGIFANPRSFLSYPTDPTS